ncbi:MAG: hypothetical protein OQK82_03685 [Candidatus Pacearchaeota archaeon]|nr:hypothetical protein [Candidatus Pacearchaeota archaeon]
MAIVKIEKEGDIYTFTHSIGWLRKSLGGKPKVVQLKHLTNRRYTSSKRPVLVHKDGSVVSYDSYFHKALEKEDLSW